MPAWEYRYSKGIIKQDEQKMVIGLAFGSKIMAVSIPILFAVLGYVWSPILYLFAAIAALNSLAVAFYDKVVINKLSGTVTVRNRLMQIIPRRNEVQISDVQRVDLVFGEKKVSGRYGSSNVKQYEVSLVTNEDRLKIEATSNYQKMNQLASEIRSFIGIPSTDEVEFSES